MLFCIIDHNLKQAAELKHLLQVLHPEECTVITLTNLNEALQTLKLVRPHYVFIEIEFPNESGFGIMDLIPNKSFKLVYTCNKNDYAVEAFKHDAHNYLLKPYSLELVDEILNLTRYTNNSSL